MAECECKIWMVWSDDSALEWRGAEIWIGRNDDRERWRWTIWVMTDWWESARVRYGWWGLMTGKGWGRSSPSPSSGRWPAAPKAKPAAPNDEYHPTHPLPGRWQGCRKCECQEMMTGKGGDRRWPAVPEAKPNDEYLPSSNPPVYLLDRETVETY